jgi:hypothetical protein
VSGDIRSVEPGDPDLQEEWLRETDEGEIRDAVANRWDAIGGWQVSVWALANIRDDPLETELRQRISTALRAVRGVTAADEQDQETFFVTGTPSGRELLEAVAQVVDDLADRSRAHMRGD